MSKDKIENLTNAFNEFTGIIEKFQDTHKILENKIDVLNKTLESKNFELEKALKKNKKISRFLDNLLENIFTGVIVIDTKGKITRFNKAAESYTGLSKERIENKEYQAIFNGFEKKKSPLYTLATRKEIHNRQKSFQTVNGKLDVQFSTTMILDSNGKLLGVVEIFNDITDLKNLQNKIFHIETLAALGEMASNVAHEIRNPLGGIKGFAGLLNRKIDKNDSRKKLVSPIIEGVKRLDHIVSNLLTFSRPQKIRGRKVLINSKVKEIMDFFKMSIEEKDKKVNLKTHLEDKKTKIFLDVELFQQIMMNFLRNAFDAVSDNGHITVSVEESIPDIQEDILDKDEMNELIQYFSYVEISVEDDGEGIPSENLKKLFNPFFSTKADGNGLGLPICKKIINLHSGDLKVESEEGKGSKFIINLPMYENYEKKNTDS